MYELNQDITAYSLCDELPYCLVLFQHNQVRSLPTVWLDGVWVEIRDQSVLPVRMTSSPHEP